MKEITLSLFRGYTDKTPADVTLDRVVRLIGEDSSIADQTEKYRYYTATGNQRDARRTKDLSLCFAVAVRFSGGKQQKHICGWTGLSMVDFDHLDAARIPELMKLIRADRHTLLCYVTISGKGIRILFRIEGLGDDNRQNLKRYDSLFLKGNEHYARLTGCGFDPQCKNATRLCGVAHDTTLFYRPDAEPFVLTAEDLEGEKQRLTEKNAERFLMRAVKAAEQTLEQRGVTYEPGKRNAYISQTGYLLNGYGIPPEEATRWAVKRFADYDGDVSGIFQSCYTHTEEHGKQPLYPHKSDEDKINKKKEPFFASVAEIETFLDTQARFRHNVVTGKGEYQLPPCEGGDGYIEMDDRFVNTLWSRMSKQVKNVRASDLRTVLASEYVPLFNPFKTYFGSLPPWDGETDYITELTDTVTVKDGERPFFRKYFKKWLIGVVASMLDPKVVNHEILVFIGEQGTYKTSWMNHLLPPELRRYFYVKTDSSRITKDDLISLSEFAIICLEEIDELKTPDMSQLKALVTKPEINERPAYGHYKERRPHLASFCGTTNNEQFLSDLTGNRRWLPIEVEQIVDPYTYSVNYTGVYSQALALYRSGFEFFLSPTEVAEVNRRNHRYEVPCIEQELIQMLFRVPMDDDPNAIFIPTAHILHRINAWVKQPLSTTKIGIAMKKAGFKPKREAGQRGYKVIELSGDRIMENARAMARFV